MKKVLPGKPYPQGATWDGVVVNFSIYSEGASAVDLCLFEDDGQASEVYRLRECTGNVWHGYLHGIKPGQLFGYRLSGTYCPERGLRFNPSKLLIDPYARALSGQVNWYAPVFSYQKESDSVMDDRDSAWGVP